MLVEVHHALHEESFHIHNSVINFHSGALYEVVQVGEDEAKCVPNGVRIEQFNIYVNWLYTGSLGTLDVDHA